MRLLNGSVVFNSYSSISIVDENPSNTFSQCWESVFNTATSVSALNSVELAKKTGCSIDVLKKIVNKGEGAYFSSGSRPNQTAQSWGYARLASTITGGKASAIDFSILEQGCNHNSRALKFAKKSRHFKNGSRRVSKV